MIVFAYSKTHFVYSMEVKMDYLQFAVMYRYSEKENIELLYQNTDKLFLIRWIERIKTLRIKRGVFSLVSRAVEG